MTAPTPSECAGPADDVAEHGERSLLLMPAPIADPVERYERLLEWADDRHDDDRGDDE